MQAKCEKKPYLVLQCCFYLATLLLRHTGGQQHEICPEWLSEGCQEKGSGPDREGGLSLDDVPGEEEVRNSPRCNDDPQGREHVFAWAWGACAEVRASKGDGHWCPCSLLRNLLHTFPE